MEGGFSYDGIDIASLGLEYAPDNPNTYVYQPAVWNNHEESFDGHNGAYFYGATVKPKDFVLRCIYQSSHVDNGQLTKIFNVFKRGRTARLVFKRRDWCWYMATVLSVDMRQMTNYMNGIVTITLRAYYPFARCDQTQIAVDDPNRESLIANSGMLDETGWYTEIDLASGGELTSQTQCLMYNCGTENAHLGIEIAGDVGDGVIITNSATGESMKFVALTKAVTTNVNKYLLLDSLNGKALLTNGATSTYGFLYHDNGVLALEPGFGCVRGVTVTGTSGATTATFTGELDRDVVGEYLAYTSSSGGTNADPSNVSAERITAVNGNTLTLATPLKANISGSCNILHLNPITVTPVGESMALTRCKLIYKPTFA